jgi:hypothetical protein
MTDMTSGPLTVDSLLSYSRLDGEAVRVVLALPDDSDVAGPKLFVRFQNDEARFRAPATLEQSSGRTRVGVTVPREQIADGLWHLKLREGLRGAPWRGLGARLLVHGDQPIALLFGKTSNIT